MPSETPPQIEENILIVEPWPILRQLSDDECWESLTEGDLNILGVESRQQWESRGKRKSLQRSTPNPKVIQLSKEDREFALKVAKNRHGTLGPVGAPRGKQKNMFRNDLIGAMGEIAICVFYGQDPRGQKAPWWGRPGYKPTSRSEATPLP